LHHGLRTLKSAQGLGQGSVSTPKLLAQTGGIGAHVCISTTTINTDCKQKKWKIEKSGSPSTELGKITPFTRF
jgi:hypothetical protein